MHQVVCKHTLFARIVYMWKGNQRKNSSCLACVGDDMSANMQMTASSERRLVTVVVTVMVLVAASLTLAALQQLRQGVPQLRQLEELAVQQLQQRA